MGFGVDAGELGAAAAGVEVFSSSFRAALDALRPRSDSCVRRIVSPFSTLPRDVLRRANAASMALIAAVRCFTSPVL